MIEFLFLVELSLYGQELGANVPFGFNQQEAVWRHLWKYNLKECALRMRKKLKAFKMYKKLFHAEIICNYLITNHQLYR